MWIRNPHVIIDRHQNTKNVKLTFNSVDFPSKSVVGTYTLEAYKYIPPRLITIIHGFCLQGTRQGHNSEVDDTWTMLVEGVNGHQNYKFQSFSTSLVKFTQYTKYFDIYDFK